MNFDEFKDQYQKVPVEEYPNQTPENPVVSVCVQTYQHAPYIRECLDSILMQETDFPFEILLGEDESTDGTREICIEYAEKHPDKIRLFLHHRENNIQILGSPTGRFNTLTNFYSARGMYIAICEGDDYWTDTEKLQKQYDFMETHADYSMCGHDAYIVQEGKVVKESKLPNSQKRDFKSLDAQNGIFVLTLSAFFKNIKEFPEECLRVFNLDTFLFIYVAKYGHYKYMPNIKPACYRLHDGGAWSARNDNLKELSDLNTQFWISKYYKRINEKKLKNHFGINVVRKSIKYLVEPSWRNYGFIIKHMFYIKFPKITSQLIRFKEFITKK